MTGRIAFAALAMCAAAAYGQTRGVSAEIRKIAGQPVVHVDGKPFPLLWGAVAREKRPDLLPHFGDMPLTAVTVHIHYGAWHPRRGEYHFAAFDRVAEEYRRENPDAYFIWDLTVYPPHDFAKRHPDHMASDDEGDTSSIGRFCWSYASRPAVEELKEMIGAAIRYVEASSYANRVIGYRVCSGTTTEWLAWAARSGHVKDFSAPNKAAFSRFASERYPALKNPHVPTLEERQALDAPYDILWDRDRHLNAIAYMEYNSWIIAQDVLETCGYAKAVLKNLGRKKLVGTYYGYTFFLNSTGRDSWRGHFALKELLDGNSGRIDFLLSPQSYSQRRIGDTCGEMKPFSTLAAAGILSVVENDARTHRTFDGRRLGYHQTVTPEQTESIVRRDASIALCRCSVPYFYALASGCDFDTPECAAVGRDVLAVQRFCLGRDIGRHAEVALVASEKSVCATPSLGALSYAETGRQTHTYEPNGSKVREPEKAALLNGEIFGLAHTKFARAGVPVDYLLAEDIADRPGDYKLYVFLNQFVSDAKTRAAVAKLRARGAALLWIYAPGRLDERSLAGMEALTGIAFAQMPGPTVAGVIVKSDGRYMGMPKAKVAQMFSPVHPDEVLGTYLDGHPGLTLSKVGNSQSFFSGTWQLDVPFIRMLVMRAGAHVWSDSDDPIEANDALFTLHARSSGMKTVHLPRKATVVDVFGRRIVAYDTDRFTFQADLHSSHLFYFGADAEHLLGLVNQQSKGADR